MGLSMRFNDQHLSSFGKNWLQFLIWGIGLIVLGLIAISASTIATLVSVVVLGFLIFFSGAIMLVDAFTFWQGKHSGFWVHFFVSLLYLFIGITLIINPMLSSVSLTLFLGIFYLIVGVFRAAFSSLSRIPNWGFSMFNGIITLILGVLILASWPASSLFVIGLFVGIDLLFLGFSYVMYALGARQIEHRLNP